MCVYSAITLCFSWSYLLEFSNGHLPSQPTKKTEQYQPTSSQERPHQSSDFWEPRRNCIRRRRQSRGGACQDPPRQRWQRRRRLKLHLRRHQSTTQRIRFRWLRRSDLKFRCGVQYLHIFGLRTRSVVNFTVGPEDLIMIFVSAYLNYVALIIRCVCFKSF